LLKLVDRGLPFEPTFAIQLNIGFLQVAHQLATGPFAWRQR